jgi:5'-3' exonuclease
MGITGLLPMLSAAMEEVHLNKLSGSVVAISGHSWIFKALLNYSMDLVEGNEVRQHVTYCMNQVTKMRKANIRPIFVFSGCELPLRQEVSNVKRQ